MTIACALTYVCIDPVIKAGYALRCFYGQSRETGDDLRAALKPFLKIVALLGMIGTAAAVSLAPPPAAAGQGQADPSNTEYVRQLDETIDGVLRERRFAWRLPREKAETPEAEEKHWLVRAVDWMAEKIRVFFAAVDRWMDSLAEWLRKRFPERLGIPSAGRDWRGIVRIVFYCIGVLLLVVLLVLARRWWLSRRTPSPKAAARPLEPQVDIRDEALTAGDLPRDRWLALARELMGRQDFRHALRALYLAVLSQLGDGGRVAIARYKSNRDYLDELTRRAHAEPELLDRFTRCMLAFERAWYGMHPVAEAQLTRFMDDQERIAALVQPAT